MALWRADLEDNDNHENYDENDDKKMLIKMKIMMMEYLTVVAIFDQKDSF